MEGRKRGIERVEAHVTTGSRGNAVKGGREESYPNIPGSEIVL